MLMDPMGGIVMTNDGNAILREVRFTPFFLVNLTMGMCALSKSPLLELAFVPLLMSSLLAKLCTTCTHVLQ